MTTPNPRRWAIFTRVVDNFGDAGVAWRLARQLAREHGCDVALYLDQLDALARFVPGLAEHRSDQRVQDVRIVHLAPGPLHDAVADVVVEAFGCGVPDDYVSRAAALASPPPWFVLEYLSAEPWVEKMHAMRSPHPRLPLMRRFWFPGFTAATGGLLREHDLFVRRDAFQRDADAQAQWWRSIGVDAAHADCKVSLFCYPNAAVTELLGAFAGGDTRVVCLVPQGVAAEALEAWAGGISSTREESSRVRGNLRVRVIPFVAQHDYDTLLWACDVNFVRGEDSFVRAQWAARPFVWHIYPQEQAAHVAKLDAFLDRYTAGLAAPVAHAARTMFAAWNGVPGAGAIEASWGEFVAALPHLRRHGARWADYLVSVPELSAGLVKAAQLPL